MIAEAALTAFDLIATFDVNVRNVVALSLQVSGAATLIGAIIGMPLGAWVAVSSSRLRSPLIVILNASMGLPPVVVGLVVYLLLSRAGPLGALGWLFTPSGMVFAQTVLIAPIIAALTRQIVEDAYAEYRYWFASLHLSAWRITKTLLHESRFSLIVVLLAGFGRAIAEVGAVMMVGGNIAEHTRVMTTTIALETSKGDLALALALGGILLALVLIVNTFAHVIKLRIGRRDV
jgi:tungstate transport system permease protein